MQSTLIAPCGMNCGICLAYLRTKNHCPGCRINDPSKSESCKSCIIINCGELKKQSSGFCYECIQFPCKRLKNLDKRYRTRYKMSMLENLMNIKENGIPHFIRNEQNRWKCPVCGQTICVHRFKCYTCGNEKY